MKQKIAIVAGFFVGVATGIGMCFSYRRGEQMKQWRVYQKIAPRLVGVSKMLADSKETNP